MVARVEKNVTLEARSGSYILTIHGTPRYFPIFYSLYLNNVIYLELNYNITRRVDC